MDIHGIIRSIKHWLLVIGIILAVAIVAGALAALTGATTFPIGFVVTVIVGAVVVWLVKNLDEL